MKQHEHYRVSTLGLSFNILFDTGMFHSTYMKVQINKHLEYKNVDIFLYIHVLDAKKHCHIETALLSTHNI